MGSSIQLTQAPGTTVSYKFGPASGISKNDAIVPRLDYAGDSGQSGVSFSNVTTFGDVVNVQPYYTLDATVVGPDPVAFRINNCECG